MEELIGWATLWIESSGPPVVLRFEPPVTVATADAYAKAWFFDNGYDNDSDWQLVCVRVQDIVTINAERGKHE